jgi:hypothetical protein
MAAAYNGRFFVTIVTFFVTQLPELCIHKNIVMNLINRIKGGWSLLKFIRVGLGSLILYSSIQNGHISGMVVGGLFTLFALFTDGLCCAGGACYAGNRKKTASTNENIEYEELGSE